MSIATQLEKNDVAWAAFASRAPSFSARKGRPTPAQLAGLKFEKQAIQHLHKTCNGFFIPRPWFKYMVSGESELRWCQPDGIFFSFRTGLITIVEIKIRHTNEAWKKLSGVYMPVVQTLFPAHLWQVALCEFTRMFDCAVACSSKPRLVESIHEVCPGEFGVVTWKP